MPIKTAPPGACGTSVPVTPAASLLPISTLKTHLFMVFSFLKFSLTFIYLFFSYSTFEHFFIFLRKFSCQNVSMFLGHNA